MTQACLSFLLGEPKREDAFGSENRIGRLRLGHDLHAAKVALAGNFRRRKRDRGAAALTADFQGVGSQLLQLLGSNLQILFE